MKKRSWVRVTAVCSIIVLMLLTCHFYLHGMDKNDGHCLLCDLLVSGFMDAEPFQLQFFLTAIALMALWKRNFIMPSYLLQNFLRAPPCKEFH